MMRRSLELHSLTHLLGGDNSEQTLAASIKRVIWYSIILMALSDTWAVKTLK
jgi:hypothetical protein